MRDTKEKYKTTEGFPGKHSGKFFDQFPVRYFFVLLLFGVSVWITGCCEANQSSQCACDTTHLFHNDSLLTVYRSDTTARKRYNTYYNVKPLKNNDGWEAYRLTMSHSFNACIQFYTLTRTSDGALLEVRQTREDRTRDTAILDKKYTVVLTREQWQTFKKKIVATCYWSNELAKDRCQSCLDGGVWVLEGYDPYKQNCAKSEEHMDICDFGSNGKLGLLCRMMRKYAQEEKLNVYTDE